MPTGVPIAGRLFLQHTSETQAYWSSIDITQRGPLQSYISKLKYTIMLESPAASQLTDVRRLRRMRPPGGTDEQGSDWFSIFVLHQNRVEHGYGQKNAIKPEYLERFLDLVIWGHEHECIPDPWVRHVFSCEACSTS